MLYQPKKKQEKQQFQEKLNIKFNQGHRQFTAFLTNFKTTSYKDKQDNQEKSALLCYFQDQDGQTIKVLQQFKPYFYVEYQQGFDKQIHSYLDQKIPKIQSIELIEKLDLEEINHLSGRKKSYFKLNFRTIKDLNNAKAPLKQLVDKKKKKQKDDDNFLSLITKKSIKQFDDIADLITGIREYDVPYHCRVCIDTGLRAGRWFDLICEQEFAVQINPNKTKQSMPDLKIMSYDIETSKDPLKFPDAEKDVVMMISLMYEGEAFLVINRGFCGHDVQEFYYSPQQQFSCHVTVYNEPSEKQVLLRFANFIQSYRPTVITTFNGDRFDYPFIKARCVANYINFTAELGVSDQGNQYYGSYISHLDCYPWVERDAYLPQGSHGLKAVTKAKLHYEPIEVDPEDMVYMAKNNTQRLAQYAVSDAVATYHLYRKHIHGFIFALSTIIPMFPDQVLRKGSGTLCQSLLMVEAFNRKIIFPNKKMEQFQKYYQGRLLDSQTYTGGKVECLRTGVYRAQFPTQFTLSPKAFDDLISNIDEIIKFSLKIEMPDVNFDDICNYEEISEKLKIPLQKLRDVKNPSKYEAKPLIYHLDVAAMYPNIILTNRLQPVAIVNDRVCSGCLFNNSQDSNCKRDLQWQWKGEVFPLNQGEYLQVKQKLGQKQNIEKEGTQEYEKRLKQQIKNYCQKIYKKVHYSTSEIKTDTVCMRQNSFYVDTVRAFRDRRYDFKRKVKEQKGMRDACIKRKDFIQADEHEKLMALYESMQLAHKIILNSFYGYVMRKGARWYSMQTAAMVTFIGSNIISDSKNFIEGRIGKPLQLDTDGIWLLLPEGFPQNVNIKFNNGKNYKLSYPCFILNHLIYQKYANPQYQTIKNQSTFSYETTKQMSIFFEIDGPYKAMMIPAAKEKQKTTELDIQQHSTQLLKKRYCVFNFKNQISEFKGFQMKRRGQLRITKVFQQEIFPQYLKGNNLKECYAQCAQTAKKYINIINKKGDGMDVQQILDYFQESRVLSKDVKDYGESKGVAINSARRLAEFLGPQVIKGKTGLTCYFVISSLPANKPVTQRAIPTQIFDAQPQIQRQFLSKWTKNEDLLKTQVDIRSILDWNYYFERLSTQIQKMICIPAVLQNLSNPIQQIELPEWLQKKTYDIKHHRQERILSYGFVQNPIDDQGQEGHKSVVKISKKLEDMVIQNREEPRITKLTRQTKNPFSMTRNFSSWLTSQKQLWKERRREDKNRTSPTDFDTVSNQQLKSIIQIVPQRTPGIFTVWYHSGGKIQQLSINVKRRYYTKDRDGTKKAPHEEGDAKEVVFDESQFMKYEDNYDCILGKKFYETKMPLLTSLVVKKGNLWRINKNLKVYNEQNVQQIFGQDYLPNIENNFLPFVYVVRCRIKQNRTIWAMMNPRSNDYRFIYVDRSTNANNDEMVNLARKQIAKDDAKITVTSLKSETQAGQAVNIILQKYQKNLKQPYLVILQCQNITELKQFGVNMLEQSLPVLYLKPIQIEQANSGSLDILDWKQKYLKRVILESDKITQEIQQLLKWSRFSHIPICNLSFERQKLDFITNVSLTRLLHQGEYLTWWNQYSSELITTYESTLYTGKLNNPGLYKTYSIEIAVQDFAINIIANSDELMMEDRQTALMMQPKTNQNQVQKVQAFDEMSKVRKQFDYVKKMIKIWIKDVQYFQNEEARRLLRNFHKWLSTRNNALYDPLLARMINELMKKVFYMLMRRLSDLGMTIVSGNFSKIIVATEKFRYEQAFNNIDYILQKCVQENQKVFKYIKLTPVNYFKCLLFKDPLNYVGIVNTQQGNGFNYKLELQHVLKPTEGRYFKLILLTFVQKLVMIKDQLQEEYSQNKMKLFLEYHKLLDQKILQYIDENFRQSIISVVITLIKQWKKAQNAKNQVNTDVQQDYFSQDEDNNLENSNDNDSSFIDDSEEDSYNQRRNKKRNRNQNEEQKIMAESQWSHDHQLDVLVENVFAWLSLEEQYKDTMYSIRKQALLELASEPTIQNWIIEPIYPSFQLPCKYCFHVNQTPGKCMICEQQLNCVQELEYTVWKMMQEQGRDTYCDRCHRLKKGFLKKCNCGGKYIYKEHPLQWVPYTKRNQKQWDFVNKVFQFMGIDQSL